MNIIYKHVHYDYRALSMRLFDDNLSFLLISDVHFVGLFLERFFAIIFYQGQACAFLTNVFKLVLKGSVREK